MPLHSTFTTTVKYFDNKSSTCVLKLGHPLCPPCWLHPCLYHWVGMPGWIDSGISKARCETRSLILWRCWDPQGMDGRYQGFHQDWHIGLPLSNNSWQRAGTCYQTWHDWSWRKGFSRHASDLPCCEFFTFLQIYSLKRFMLPSEENVLYSSRFSSG